MMLQVKSKRGKIPDAHSPPSETTFTHPRTPAKNLVVPLNFQTQRKEQ